MGISITIDDLDNEILQRLRDEASRRGVGVNVIISELLMEGLQPVNGLHEKPLYHDLDALSGTWSQRQAEAFMDAIADFERVACSN